MRPNPPRLSESVPRITVFLVSTAQRVGFNSTGTGRPRWECIAAGRRPLFEFALRVSFALDSFSGALGSLLLRCAADA
jgi:hypothetical protein